MTYLLDIEGVTNPEVVAQENFERLDNAFGLRLAADAVTGLTGGGSTNLDGIATLSLPVGSVVRVWNGTQVTWYRLTAGTTAESSPTVIRPDDYAASTNEKVWLLMSEQINGSRMYGNLVLANPATDSQTITRGDDDGLLALYGGSLSTVGAVVALNGEDRGSSAGNVFLQYGGGTGGSNAQSAAAAVISRLSAGNVSTEMLRLDWSGNLRMFGAAQPTSLANGMVLGNGTAASANPTNAVSLWAASGEWQYRCSGSSEGDGRTHRVHNRAVAATINAGDSYTVTSSFALISFGAGARPMSVVLPSAGTYQILLGVFYSGDGVNVGFAQLYNLDDTAVLWEDTYGQWTTEGFFAAQAVVTTVTASKTIQARFKAATAGQVVGDGCYLVAVRLS